MTSNSSTIPNTAKSTIRSQTNARSQLSNRKAVPFGFGSSSPSRADPKFPDTPGPGKYEIYSSGLRPESIRGCGPGFTSHVPRKLDWGIGNKTPSPCAYLPLMVDHHVKPKIGSIPDGRRCTFLPDERESSMTPGPASYNLPELKSKGLSAAFRSRSRRDYIPPPPKHQPRFDGKVFTIRRFDFK